MSYQKTKELSVKLLKTTSHVQGTQEPTRKGSDWPKGGQLNISKGNNWYGLKLIKFIQMHKFIMILRKKPFIGSFWRMLENQYILKTD